MASPHSSSGRFGASTAASPAVSIVLRGRLRLQTLKLLWRPTTVALLKTSAGLRAMGAPELTLVVDRADFLGGRLVVPLESTKDHPVRLLPISSRRGANMHTIAIEYGVDAKKLRLRASNDDEFRVWSAAFEGAIKCSASGVATHQKVSEAIDAEHSSSVATESTRSSTCSVATLERISTASSGPASNPADEEDVAMSEVPAFASILSASNGLTERYSNVDCDYYTSQDEVVDEEESLFDSASSVRWVLMHAMSSFPLEHDEEATDDSAFYRHEGAHRRLHPDDTRVDHGIVSGCCETASDASFAVSDRAEDPILGDVVCDQDQRVPIHGPSCVAVLSAGWCCSPPTPATRSALCDNVLWHGSEYLL